MSKPPNIGLNVLDHHKFPNTLLPYMSMETRPMVTNILFQSISCVNKLLLENESHLHMFCENIFVIGYVGSTSFI